jgi:ABC-2 type transport system ATP-binding protein
VLVEAEDLTRYYGDFRAVDHISFGIDRGEIVGLLGPNGAGKTTTIRMLSGFLPASGGTARIAGRDVHDEPVAVRRHIGYMPENNPLYPEMRTSEYLAFRANLKGVPRRQRARRIAECMDLCGLRGVTDQIIGTLSKGYRQRVGLADAMLASPDVLILDEPTIGLDPNQIRETRNLIRSLSDHHTVLISTHILAEAEAICKRVLIIDKGRIIADDEPRALSSKTLLGTVVAEVKADREAVLEGFARFAGAGDMDVEEVDGWQRVSIPTSADSDVREEVFRLAVDRGWGLRELTQAQASLEDVFHRLTLGPGASDSAREKGGMR